MCSIGDHCAVGVQSISWFCNKADFWIIIKLIPCCFIIWFAKEYSASLKSNHFRFRGSENHEILAELMINHARQIVLQYLGKNQTKSGHKRTTRGVGGKCVVGTGNALLTQENAQQKTWNYFLSHFKEMLGSALPQGCDQVPACASLFVPPCAHFSWGAARNYPLSPEDMATVIFFF